MTREARSGLRVAVLGIKRLPAFAGADRVVEQLLERFSPENEYTIYLIRDGAPTLTCTANRHYVYVPALKGKHLRAPSYFLLCCAHYLVKGHYEVAHVHNSDFGIFCPLLRLKPDVRIIGTFHGDPATREKWGGVAKWILRLSEAVFVRVCNTLTSVSADKRVDGAHIHYIPNGVSRSQRRDPRKVDFPYEELGLRKGEYVMFACGRLDRTKGLHHLLEAYRGTKSDARLLVVGDFSHDSGYSEEISRVAGEDARVVLHKELLDEQSLVEVLGNSSVFVFPSEVEGMSMMLLEAITFGRVVVCSDIPANVAVVGENYRFLFRSEDSSALLASLEEALPPSSEVRDAQVVRERVAASFGWEGIASAYERLYVALEKAPA